MKNFSFINLSHFNKNLQEQIEKPLKFNHLVTITHLNFRLEDDSFNLVNIGDL